MTPVIRIQREGFETGAEIAGLTAGRTDIGAVVSFCGLCRDEAGRLATLELEHYPGMAQAEIGRVADEAIVRAAIDHAHVKPAAMIAGAREIAFFPPMTGG